MLCCVSYGTESLNTKHKDNKFVFGTNSWKMAFHKGREAVIKKESLTNVNFFLLNIDIG